MKEAFDLIRKRIEEIRVDNRCGDCVYKSVCDKVQEEAIVNDQTDLCGVTIKAVALSIVSEVEAEYGKDINVRSNGWIDVKDRLPEKYGYYLTCDHKGNIHVFYHHPSYVTNGSNMAFGICKNHSQFYKPIAWMELPKPYNRLERK